MLVVVAYDICTKDGEGKKRLRRVARICANWGTSVQASLYECEVNAEQLERVRNELKSVIRVETDSVCLYQLGNQPYGRAERIGDGGGMVSGFVL